MNLSHLIEHGQSYWIDNLTRRMIRDGGLARRVGEEALGGVTSNPSIFHKAISTSRDYDDQIREETAIGRSAGEIYEALATADVRAACDILRPVFDRSGGGDGFVSLEVSPHLARDTAGSIAEARHGGPAQSVHQDSRHGGRRARRGGTAVRGYQRQHHPPLFR